MSNPDGPLTKKYLLELSPPSLEDPLADLERVCAALEPHGVFEPDVPLSVASAVPRVLRQSGFVATAVISGIGRPRLIALEGGDTTGVNLGLAVDLGTTNVAARLIDLASGKTLGEAVEENPQVAHGDDILTRIHFCLEEGGLNTLQGVAASCISSLADRLAKGAGAKPSEIHCMSVSGNTTMAHMLIGLDPYNIPRDPYVPVANRFPLMRARELGLGVNPEGIVYVLPNVGSYVGGDVLAGILVSGMHKKDEISVLVDVGTNAEIVIGNSQWLMVAAGAAGPALEGGVARFGMRAAPGAIERVVIDPVSKAAAYTVIGGGGVRPKGLCGSALIDLLAGLFTAGVIDERGRFIVPEAGPAGPHIRKYEDEWAYVVAPGEGTESGHDIIFTETDIENLIRTKAAMYTALSVVTAELGIGFGELASFYVAGTFGAYIAADKAVAIGMLPDIGLDKYTPLGNSSIEGAASVLSSSGSVGELNRVSGMVTYRQLNVSTDFMSEFRASMFLPHTDKSLFPSSPKEL